LKIEGLLPAPQSISPVSPKPFLFPILPLNEERENTVKKINCTLTPSQHESAFVVGLCTPKKCQNG